MTLALDRRSLLTGAIGAAAGLTLPAKAAARRAFFQRIGRPIGVQLYALGDEAQKDLGGTLMQLAKIGYRDLELPGLMGRKPTEIRQLADAAGLGISSVHVPTAGAFSIRSSPQELADSLGVLGARHAVVPMFGMPAGFKLKPGADFAAQINAAIESSGARMWIELADLLNERAALLKPHGIAVGYHNHSAEFRRVGKRTAWEILAARTDPKLVHFEVDIGWVTSAGLDPVAFFRKYTGRCRQVHVKDVKRGFKPNTALQTIPTEVGSGVIDWARVLPAAYAAGVRNFYFEQEPPFAISRMEAAAKSFAFLSQLRA